MRGRHPHGFARAGGRAVAAAFAKRVEVYAVQVAGEVDVAPYDRDRTSGFLAADGSFVARQDRAKLFRDKSDAEFAAENVEPRTNKSGRRIPCSRSYSVVSFFVTEAEAGQ